MAVAIGIATSIVGGFGMLAAAGALVALCDFDAAAATAPSGAAVVEVHPSEPPFRGCAITYQMADGSVEVRDAPANAAPIFGGVLLLGLVLIALGARSEALRQRLLGARPAPSSVR